jgi:NADH-quinone oxidoreductase subunit M
MTFDEWLLSLVVFLPLAGALVIAALPKGNAALIRLTALVVSGAALGFGILALIRFDFDHTRAFQFEVNTKWIESIGARYHMGVDGIALPLLILTVALTFLCVVYSQRILPKPQDKMKGFFALILLLETGMAGTFTSLDLVLFFVFWEMVLVPMYFIIAIWGSERKEYSAIKFFLYTLFGSVFMLLGFLAMYFKSVDPVTGGHTFDMIRLQGQHFGGVGFQNLVFLGLFLGFAIKVPMWPFHTWLPDAHGDAPTVGSVLLAGILLKMGAYGFIRIGLPLLPEAAKDWAPYIGGLAVISILYGSLCCLAQRDIKRLIAFSSVGHMGFIMLGISTLTDKGINAAIFGMVAHGVITGMLFFLAGSLYERYHTRVIDDIGPGVLQKLPRMGAIFVFAAIASLTRSRGLLGRGDRFTRRVQPVARPSQRLVPRVHGARGRGHDPDRGIHALAHPASEPRSGPREMGERSLDRRRASCRSAGVVAAPRRDRGTRCLSARGPRHHERRCDRLDEVVHLTCLLRRPSRPRR